MTIYKRKDIIFVPFPFSELNYQKKRPALVMASLSSRDELICLMLTSTKQTDFSVDVSLKKLNKTGLPKPTVARTSRIFTFKSSLVIKKIGIVNDDDFRTITDKVIKLLKG